MTPELKKFIEENISLIETNQFDELFRLAEHQANMKHILTTRSNHFATRELTEALLNANVEFLSHLSRIPFAFATMCNFPNGNITLSNKCTFIEDVAFSESNIRNIEFPLHLKTIGEFAFMDCSELTTINLPDSVTELGIRCFSNCKNLKSIKLGKSLLTVCSHLLCDCTSLTEVVLPASVSGIEGMPFWGCTSLTDIKYEGTSAQWEAIDKSKYWSDMSAIEVVHCQDKDVLL